MVYDYCKACNTRAEECLLPDSHRALNRIVWCCDFLLGGKPPKGKRIRKQFPSGVTKKDVEKFEHITIADYERGTFIPQDKGKIPLKDVIERYNTEHIKEHSRHPNGSVKTYLEALKRGVGALPIGIITLSTLEQARTAYKDETESSNSNVNRCMAVLKTVFNRAVEWGYIKESPAKFLKALPIKETMPRFLSVEEINKLRGVIKDKRLDDYVVALLHTGIRPIDLKALTWSQVNLDQRFIHVTTHKGRRAHQYTVPIDDELYKVIDRRFKETKGTGLVFDTSNVRKLAEEAINLSGINEGRKPEERFTIYGLKHCYASHLLMNGASIFDVAKLLGHTDTTMVIKHYGFLTQEHLRSVQSKINLTPALQQQFEVI